MNCNQIKEWILSDYSDGEATLKVTAAVEGHLKSCNECREFQALAKSASEPLRKAVEQRPSEYVWHRIKDKLADAQEEHITSIWEIVLQRLASLIFTPKLAFATTIMTIVFVSAIVFQVSVSQRRAAVQDYFSDQADFFTYLNVNSQYSKTTDTPEFDNVTESLL